MSKKEMHCHYCRVGLGCVAGSIDEREYWRTNEGLLACDKCLLQNADDFPNTAQEERLFWLRAKYVRGINIESMRHMMVEAGKVIIPEQVGIASRGITRALDLFKSGKQLAALEAAQAAWNTVNHLYDCTERAPSLIRDRKRQAGPLAKTGSRMPELDAWLDANLPASNDTLWESLPAERDDFTRAGIYRDGDAVIEYRDDTEHPIKRAGFNKRVTAARKRR